MADYGTPLNVAPSAMKRKKVGEADSETRKRMLAEALHPGTQTTYQPKPAAANEQMGVSPNTMRLLKNRGKQIDDVVDSMQEVKKIGMVKALRR